MWIMPQGVQARKKAGSCHCYNGQSSLIFIESLGVRIHCISISHCEAQGEQDNTGGPLTWRQQKSKHLEAPNPY